MKLFDAPFRTSERDRTVLLVPKGRSLQKTKTDFENPRLIYRSVDLTFLGYAPTGSDVEVISWNPALRKFEFKLIENYQKDKVPHAKTIKDSSCTVCHQNHGPIFPRAPWREMTSLVKHFEDGKSVYSHMLPLLPEKFYGADVRHLSENQGRTNSAVMDGGVRVANAFSQIQNVCKKICGTELQCRTMLLQSALETAVLGKRTKQASSDPFEFRNLAEETRGFLFPAGFEEFKRGVIERWPSEQFAIPSSTLPDRNPFVLESTSPGFRMFVEDKMGSSKEVTDYDEKTSRSKFDNTSEKYNFNEVALRPTEGDLVDPLHLRPLTRKILPEDAPYFVYDAGVHCIWPNFANTEQDVKALQNVLSTREDVEAAIKTPGVVAALNGPWPDVREAVILAILKARHVTDEKLLSCYQPSFEAKLSEDLSTLTSAVSASLEEKTVEVKPVRAGPQKLKMYCAECHRPDNMPLPLDNLGALKEYKSKRGKSLLERLRMPKGKAGSMPPFRRDHSELYDEWESDRDEIIRLIEQAT